MHRLAIRGAGGLDIGRRRREMGKSASSHVFTENGKSLFCRDDDMSDTGLGSDAGPGNIETLLAGIYQFEVSIKDLHFRCHSYPFPLKSSYFKAAIQSFKTSVASSRDNADLRINLSELPGGSRAFELIRGFCYESRIRITKQNVLDLLSASKFLGFTEDIAPNNLHERCHTFVEVESTNGFQGILIMLAHSTTNDSHVTDYEVLFNKLAEQALIFQDPDYDYENEMVELLVGLTKLKTGFVDATLQEFERLGVNMIDFFWCRETSTNLCSMLDCCRTNGLTIFSYFVKTLDKCIDAGEVLIDTVNPKKLVMVWNPEFLIKGPLLSENVMKAYVSSHLCRLKAEDIIDLRPELIRELITTAVSASRSSMLMREENQHLGGLVDEVLLLEAKRCPWDGSLDSKINFQQMAECIPLSERESHDTFYNAVACFSRSFTLTEATEIWNLIDTEKLSPPKLEVAIQFTLSQESSYLARLFGRINSSLKRKISDLEEHESKRRARRDPDSCGSEFTIFVRSLDGKSLCVLVQAHTTVFSIKEGIEKMGNIQFQRPWWLVYQRKKLPESLPIASFGIQKDCTLCIKVLYDRERDQPVWDEKPKT